MHGTSPARARRAPLPAPPRRPRRLIRGRAGSSRRCKEAFDLYDHQGAGKLPLDTVQRLLDTVGEVLRMEEIKDQLMLQGKDVAAMEAEGCTWQDFNGEAGRAGDAAAGAAGPGGPAPPPASRGPPTPRPHARSPPAELMMALCHVPEEDLRPLKSFIFVDSVNHDGSAPGTMTTEELKQFLMKNGQNPLTLAEYDAFVDEIKALEKMQSSEEGNSFAYEDFLTVAIEANKPKGKAKGKGKK